MADVVHALVTFKSGDALMKSGAIGWVMLTDAEALEVIRMVEPDPTTRQPGLILRSLFNSEELYDIARGNHDG